MTDWLLVNSNVANATIAEPLTKYAPVAGGFSAFGTVTNTETNGQNRVRASYTAKNLWCQVLANSITDTTTVKFRKNSADGNQVLSIPASTTGTFEDTSNTDSLVADDLICYQVITPAVSGTPTIAIRPFSVILNNASNVGMSIASIANGTGTATDFYYPIAGYLTGSATEALIQATARTAGTLSKLRIYVTSSTALAATVTSRINGANGNQSVSISAGATGEFADTTNSDTFVAGDELSTFFDVTAGTAQARTIKEYQITGAVRLAAGDNTGTGALYSNLSYVSLTGRMAANLDTTEANVQVKARTTAPLKNLFVYVAANTSVSTNTVGLRRNGSTVISVSIPTVTTGVFEETTTSIIPVATDLLNYIIDASAAVSNLTLSLVSIEQLAQYSMPIDNIVSPRLNRLIRM